MTTKRIDFREWLFRLIAWDGLLPVFIVFVPMLFTLVFPQNQDVVAMTAVLLPIAAFLWRIRNGLRQISSNRCHRWMQFFQSVVLVVGLFSMTLFDCVLILSNILPKGAIFQADEMYIWGTMLAIYMTSLVIAMYPGRKEVPADEWEQYWSARAKN